MGHVRRPRVHLEGLMVNLVNIYAPTLGPEQLCFFQQACAFLGALDPHECLVLGGDFNTTLEERDRLGTEQCPAATDVLREIVDHHSLVDVWRDHHPDDASTFTFVRVEAHRLRYSERPGPAYWHFNNSLLEDVGFVASFREFWLACRRRDAAIGQLEREVLELERRLAASPEDPSLCGACREKWEELRALEDHRSRGAFVRSRIRLLREMDRGSRFFYALEKKRGAKKHTT
ncbi:unnamed protein product [Caretta caretta]